MTENIVNLQKRFSKNKRNADKRIPGKHLIL